MENVFIAFTGLDVLLDCGENHCDVIEFQAFFTERTDTQVTDGFLMDS